MTDYYKVLEDLIIKHGLEEYKEQIFSISKPQLLVSRVEEDNYEQLGNTRFGGYPDLPEDIEYPKMINLHGEEKYLDFLCQLNLKDFSQYDLNLPKEGMLYFFSGQLNMNDINNRMNPIYENSKIFYSKENILELSYSINDDLFLNNTKVGITLPFLVEINLISSIPDLDNFLHIFNLKKDNFLYKNEYEDFYNEWKKLKIFTNSLAEFYLNNQLTFDSNIFIYDAIENININYNPFCTFFNDGFNQCSYGDDLIIISAIDNIEHNNYFFSYL